MVHDASMAPGRGLTEAQLDRLAALESQSTINGWEAGEARALAMLASGQPVRDRALAVAERAGKPGIRFADREKAERARLAALHGLGVKR
jgi:hypothetical protein